MNKPKHACPLCRTPYAVWKLILCRTNRAVCSSCGARLGWSIKTNQRVGAVAGLAFVLIFIPLLAIPRLSILSWWPFLPAFLILFYFIGGLTAASLASLCLSRSSLGS